MNKGAAVFALGIGPNVEVSELGKIASNPENVVTIDSFEDLTDKVKDFRDGFCKAPLPATTTAPPITTPADPCTTVGCNAPYNIGCKNVNNTAECICPDCPDTVSPVCTSDHVQDRSECLTKRQSCESGEMVTVGKNGPCDKECSPIVDIGFVIDSSGSIGRRNWARMKRFLKAMVSKLDISPSNTHISAIAYSNNPKVVYRFNNRQETNDVNAAFDGMRWQRGFTYTDKAILLAESDLY
ncbi:integrin alpha-D-like [Stylophora pistillata]|uniref:integrin alpha-D-like n=1 Tax=Stylophora pistillata TaxID=50429 RepID=UPI000C0425B9|nr:integrin alpha-D-like [Stylophora pistillata]